MRISDWSSDVCSSDLPTIAINDTATPIERRDGYALLRRRWRAGDRITLTLPMTLAVEPTPDDPNVVAYTHGPVVLAADLGPANQPFDRSEEHTSELQSLMRLSYAVFCLKKKKTNITNNYTHIQ